MPPRQAREPPPAPHRHPSPRRSPPSRRAQPRAPGPSPPRSPPTARPPIPRPHHARARPGPTDRPRSPRARRRRRSAPRLRRRCRPEPPRRCGSPERTVERRPLRRPVGRVPAGRSGLGARVANHDLGRSISHPTGDRGAVRADRDRRVPQLRSVVAGKRDGSLPAAVGGGGAVVDRALLEAVVGLALRGEQVIAAVLGVRVDRRGRRLRRGDLEVRSLLEAAALRRRRVARADATVRVVEVVSALRSRGCRRRRSSP